MTIAPEKIAAISSALTAMGHTVKSIRAYAPYGSLPVADGVEHVLRIDLADYRDQGDDVWVEHSQAESKTIASLVTDTVETLDLIDLMRQHRASRAEAQG